MKHPPFWTRVTAIGTKRLELTRMVSQLAGALRHQSIEGGTRPFSVNFLAGGDSSTAIEV
jgi:hypothetical protein